MFGKFWAWNPRVAVFFDVPVHVHSTVFVFLPLLLVASGVLPFLVTLLALVSVVPHEYGHILAARRCGCGCRKVLMLPIGGVALLEGMPKGWRQEFWVAAWGPLVSLALCLFSLPVALLALPWTELPLMFSVVNLALCLFNCLPIMPLDGGRLLRALLHSSMSYKDATWYSVRFGQGLAVLLALALVLTGNVMGVLTIGLVALMAEAELIRTLKGP